MEVDKAAEPQEAEQPKESKEPEEGAEADKPLSQTELEKVKAIIGMIQVFVYVKIQSIPSNEYLMIVIGWL